MIEQLEHTWRDLASLDTAQQPLYITYPETTGTPFELKTRLIHLLPIFNGRVGEDPHKYTQEFQVVCDRMRSHVVTKELINLHNFPFSLKKLAKV